MLPVPAGEARGHRGRNVRPGKAPVMKLSVLKCYGLAWRSFAKWWIPLCLISGALFVFQILPQLLASPEMKKIQGTTNALLTAAAQNDFGRFADALAQAQSQLYAWTHQYAKYSLFLFPLVALCTVFLLMYANWAVKDSREKRRPLAALAYIALVHVVMAVVKMAALVLFIVPAVYLYIKLLFVSLVMLEQKKGAAEAIATSWRMTRGNFWQLLLLMLMNGALQSAAMVTVIGLIPATGFANTARAAAFRMLLEDAGPENLPVLPKLTMPVRPK